MTLAAVLTQTLTLTVTLALPLTVTLALTLTLTATLTLTLTTTLTLTLTLALNRQQRAGGKPGGARNLQGGGDGARPRGVWSSSEGRELAASSISAAASSARCASSARSAQGRRDLAAVSAPGSGRRSGQRSSAGCLARARVP